MPPFPCCSYFCSVADAWYILKWSLMGNDANGVQRCPPQICHLVSLRIIRWSLKMIARRSLHSLPKQIIKPTKDVPSPSPKQDPEPSCDGTITPTTERRGFSCLWWYRETKEKPRKWHGCWQLVAIRPYHLLYRVSPHPTPIFPSSSALKHLSFIPVWWCVSVILALVSGDRGPGI